MFIDLSMVFMMTKDVIAKYLIISMAQVDSENNTTMEVAILVLEFIENKIRYNFRPQYGVHDDQGLDRQGPYHLHGPGGQREQHHHAGGHLAV